MAQHAEPGTGEPQQAERALALGHPARHAHREGAPGDGQAGQDHHVGELLVGVVRGVVPSEGLAERLRRRGLAVQVRGNAGRVGVLHHRPGPLDRGLRPVRRHVQAGQRKGVQPPSRDIHGRQGDPRQVAADEGEKRRDLRRCRPRGTTAETRNARQLGARHHRGRGAVNLQLRAGDGQPPDRPELGDAPDAGDLPQPGQHHGRRRRLGSRRGPRVRAVRELVDEDVAGRCVGHRREVLGVLRGDQRRGHGEDEQRYDQAADRPERGPRVVGQPPRGDQPGRGAGPPGQHPGPRHGQPRPRDDQTAHDQRPAGQVHQDLPTGAGRRAVHGEEPEAGQSGQQRQHPPGPRRRRGHPPGDPERGDGHPAQRQPGHQGGRQRVRRPRPP